MEKINASAFVRILKEHGIESLYHFTDRKNIESIMQHGGLYSWKDCIEQGIDISRPGGDAKSRELDIQKGLEYYVHTSFTKNHPMMFSAKNDGRIEDPVVLEIDPIVITWIDTKFSDKNSTRSDMYCGEKLEDFITIHFETTKHLTHFYLDDSEMPYFQAEVMVKNFIPLKYIKNINNFGVYFWDFDEHLEFVRHHIYADKGNAIAQLCLGMDYYYGRYGRADKKDYEKAFKYYRMSAEQGLADAQFRLALCYDNGEGTTQNSQKALFWYEKAALQEHKAAIFNLAASYSNGIEIEKNPTLAFYWFKKGAEIGSPDCQRQLGLCYENGFGTERDYRAAMYWYTESANQNNAEAQFNLANCFHNGEITPQDFHAAFEWYMKSAELGHPYAQNTLGEYYKNGIGVDVNYAESAKWYLLAAEQGIPSAQYNIGCFYFNGIGIEKDIEKALYWFRKGAEKGNADAQNNLGFCYITGHGVPQNTPLAIKWWEKAAYQGHKGAIRNLEICKANGDY